MVRFRVVVGEHLDPFGLMNVNHH